ncbi:MAG: hypothetical protein ACOCZ9_01520 [Spirochaetota bacterium]
MIELYAFVSVWNNRWEFYRETGVTDRGELPGLLRNIGGIDDLALFDRSSVDDRLIT